MFRRTPSKSKLSQDELGVLFLMAAIIFGAWFRIYPTLTAGFPINDGGLFFAMTEAIQNHGFHLPEYIQYNGLNIPFAYPPFAFYITGFTQTIFKIPLIELFRWLPALFTTLTIPAIYLLAYSILGTRIQAGIAAFLYALLPRAITWLVMGGGLSRSLGQLFLLLTAYHVYKLFKIGTKKHLFQAILFSTLVCLSHPEATIHTIGIALLFLAFNWRNVSAWLHAGLVGLGTLLLTSVWWLTCLLRFGPDPFISASQTGLRYPLALFNFWLSPFSDEPLITIVIVLAMIGIVVQLARREYLLPLFYVLPVIIEPRSAATVSTVPMALLASATFCRLLFPGLARLSGTTLQGDKILSNKPEKILLTYFGIVLFLSMQYYGIRLSSQRVNEENLKAFEWISANIPQNNKFILITGNTDLFSDSTQEWFPVLSGGISQTTIQGQEWLLKDGFSDKARKLQAIQICGYDNKPFQCIEGKLDKSLFYNYIYITSGNQIIPQNNGPLNSGTLIASLLQNEKFSLVYKTDGVAIFHYSE